MKAILLSLAVSLSSFGLVAGSEIDDDDVCKRLYKLSGLTVTESVERDLLQGHWKFENAPGEEVILNFYDNGLASRLELNTESDTKVEHLLWSTYFMDNMSWLIFQGEDGQKEYYRLNQTCDGILLDDLESEREYFLDYHYSMTESEMLMTKVQIEGTWTSAMNPFQFDEEAHGCTESASESPVLEWTFDESSSFALSILSGGKSFEGQGIWDLSHDGQYLILYFLGSDNPEDVIATSVMRIAELTFEDLVSYQRDLPQELGYAFCDHWKAIHYTRI